MLGMEPVAVVTAIILIQYLVFGGLVGKARVQNKISAPATTGNPEFERYLRVQLNTAEQLIVVLPAMWMFAWYIDIWIAAVLGLLFVVARIIYCKGYVADPATRGKGFVMGWLATIIMVLGSLIGALLAYFG